MSSYRKKILCVTLCAVLCVVFVITLHFSTKGIAVAPETTGVIDRQGYYDSAEEGTNVVLGKDVTALRISDLNNLQKITKINYVPNEFVSPNSFPANAQIVDLTKPFEFAEKGTLIVVVMNLNPESADFREQANRLAPFKIGDYWHFTLALPKIFCASNIYQGSSLVARNGDIENYDFSKYTTNYNVQTQKFSAKTTRTFVDLQFYTRRQAINPYQIVTIHYQSGVSAYSAMTDSMLIGTENVVTRVNETSQNMLIVVSAFAAVVFFVLVVLSLLKHTAKFLPAIVWIIGIVLILFPKFVLGETTYMPLLWVALSYSSAFLTTGGALFEIGKSFKHLAIRFVFPALMLVGGVLAIICPFVPYATSRTLRVIYVVLKGIGGISLLTLAGIATFRKTHNADIWETATATIIAIAVIASLFVSTVSAVFPVYINSIFWLCVVTVVMTFVGVFGVFEETEKANKYLTNNLNLEVEKQLTAIKAVVAERDNLLQFVSHDMKKPLQSSAALLDTLIDREKDPEQEKALKIVKQNNARVIENLSDIGSFARFNYIAEPSQVTNLCELCNYIYEFHQPDCNANGIVLKNNVISNYKVFVKRQGLENAVTNIILNAIEHADCKTVTLSAKAEKNRVILSIADDGVGIDKDLDVFGAYVSGSKESNGLGLFICKSIVETMNGELTYESTPNGTTFYISLLKA